MKHKQGDMFTTDAPAIGHGCNIRGAMGAGVAAIVARKFPNTEARYRDLCMRKVFDGGEVLVTREFDPRAGNVFIFNMMTQVNPGADASLELIKTAAENAVNEALQRGIFRIAIPQIGCGIGGLRWEDVEPVLKKTEKSSFEWEVWTL